MGRHTAPGDEDDDIDVPIAELGTRGDLQLLRENPAVRARCIAGALVPFALYTIAMVASGMARDFAIWVWVPIVVAGVCVGICLDLGYRSLRRPDDDSGDGRHNGADEPTPPADAAPSAPSAGLPGFFSRTGD